MKIALIISGRGWNLPLLGIGYIASYLRKYSKYNPEIKIFDENSGDKIIKLFKKFDPDIVCMTATTPMITRAIELANEIKKIKKIPIILGGPHITGVPETLKNSSFDIGVIGEGEETILELINNIIENKEIKDEKIKGIAFIKNNKLIINERRELIKDLDKIPPPARDLINMKYYSRPKESLRGIIAKGIHIISSRGCPFDCSYCSNKLLWNRRVRLFSPEYVIKEVNHLIETYNIDGLYFVDDNFTTNKEWMKKVCKLFKENNIHKKIFWIAQSRVDSLTQEDISILKDAGCIRIEFGIESGSDRTLKEYNKVTTVEQAKKALKLCNDNNIMTLSNYVIGAPNETVEDIELTRKFFKENKSTHNSVYIMTPYPGTKMYDEYIRNKVDINTIDWNGFYMGDSLAEDFTISKLPRRKLIALYKETLNDAKDLEKEGIINLYKHRNINDNLWAFKRKILDWGKQYLPQNIKNITRNIRILKY